MPNLGLSRRINLYGSFYYTYGLIPLALLFVVAIFMIPLSGFGSTPFPNQPIVLPPMTNATTPQAMFSPPFELKSNRNVRITASAPVNNSFADLDIDLINDQNNEVESVNIPIEYYTGTDSDGAWTEGGQQNNAIYRTWPEENTLCASKNVQTGNSMPHVIRVKISFAAWISFALLLFCGYNPSALFRKFSLNRDAKDVFGNYVRVSGKCKWKPKLTTYTFHLPLEKTMLQNCTAFWNRSFAFIQCPPGAAVNGKIPQSMRLGLRYLSFSWSQIE